MLIRLLLIVLCYININLCSQNNRNIVNSNTLKEYPQIFVEKAEGILENKVKSELLETLTIKKINIYDKPIYNIDSNLTAPSSGISSSAINASSGVGILAAHSYASSMET